jgi:DNA-directed RNA polymerase specialized sigma24 family protein
LLAVPTDEERAIFVMSYACGLSHREIGESMQMPAGTVKSVLFRGKDKIRTRLEIEDHQHGCRHFQAPCPAPCCWQQSCSVCA